MDFDSANRAAMGNDPGAMTTECLDGTVCENGSPCLAHPYKEGSYMCDCTAAATWSSDYVQYAGVYCEHRATAYCEKGSVGSAHAFCTNGGTCRLMVGRNEEHEGCVCPRGYEGNFCQFVEGSMPSDWTVENFMHPMLLAAYGARGGYGAKSTEEAGIVGAVLGAGVAFLFLAAVVVGFLYCAPLKEMREKLRRGDKEMDTAESSAAEMVAGETSLGGRRTSAASPKNASFLGGKSVYKKKTSTGHFVTEDTMDADGGVLTEALGDQGLGANGTIAEEQGLGGEGGASMEEVNLDEEPSTPVESGTMA